MARINLLPWREELRQEKKKEFLTQLAGVAILAALIAYVWVETVNGALQSQNSRNQMLQTEISTLEKQVQEIKDLKSQRQELLDRMRVIQDLEGKRAVIVYYFDEFAKAVPDGVYLTSLKRVGGSFHIEGVSESNNRVAAFMRELDNSDWFSDPNLKSVKKKKELGEQHGEFEMEVKAVIPNSEEDDNG